jgi:hypothetical protein
VSAYMQVSIFKACWAAIEGQAVCHVAHLDGVAERRRVCMAGCGTHINSSAGQILHSCLATSERRPCASPEQGLRLGSNRVSCVVMSVPYSNL